MEYVPRRLEPRLDGLLHAVPAVSLLGPRAVGKTTLARRLCAGELRLDRPEDASLVVADPDAALRGRPEPLLIDEWQAVPEVLAAVKRAVDDDPRPGRFLLTGSVRAVLDDAGWAGTGRVVPLELFGIVPAETEPRVGEHVTSFIDRVFAAGDPAGGRTPAGWTLPAYVRRALDSGFPLGMSAASAGAGADWLEGYVTQLLSRDLGELGPRTDSVLVRRFAEALAAHSATDVAMQTLSEAAGTTWHTTEAHWNLLERLRVVQALPAWHANRLKRLTRSAKRYLVDPALAVPLLGVDADAVLHAATLRGRVLETWVVMQLAAEVQWSRTRARLHHLRSRDRREVDIVLEGPAGRIVGVEVKAAAAVDARDARHLTWLRDGLGDTFHRGVVLHTGQHTFRLDERIHAAPIAALWAPEAWPSPIA